MDGTVFLPWEKDIQCPIDVVLDTDAYNEIDDQYAIAYLVRSAPSLRTCAIYAAPFLNKKVATAKEGMEKSHDEINRLMALLKQDIKIFRGSEDYLAGETVAARSDAAQDLVARAKGYTWERPLYVVAIGAITNVASALLIRPEIKDRMVVVWLGGNAHHAGDTREFNMLQDVATARVVFESGVRLVQVPCRGVSDVFMVTKPELVYWLKNKNEWCNFLVDRTIAEAESYAAGKPWSRVIWDVVAVGWLLNGDGRFMTDHLVPSPIPQYDNHYSYGLGGTRPWIRYVCKVNRDALMEDLFQKLTE